MLAGRAAAAGGATVMRAAVSFGLPSARFDVSASRSPWRADWTNAHHGADLHDRAVGQGSSLADGQSLPHHLGAVRAPEILDLGRRAADDARVSARDGVVVDQERCGVIAADHGLAGRGQEQRREGTARIREDEGIAALFGGVAAARAARRLVSAHIESLPPRGGRRLYSLSSAWAVRGAAHAWAPGGPAKNCTIPASGRQRLHGTAGAGGRA